MEYMDAVRIVTNVPHLNWDYLAFEYSMNIYWGCSHGCIYCYVRSDYYDQIGNMHGNMECIKVKNDALQIIRNDLQRKVKTGVVFTGGMSDAYNPKEKELKLTRNALELINAFGFGVCIITKSDLVIRDTELYADIKEHSPASVNFSITCSDDELSRKIEPYAPSSSDRFRALERNNRKLYE